MCGIHTSPLDKLVDLLGSRLLFRVSEQILRRWKRTTLGKRGRRDFNCKDEEGDEERTLVRTMLE